MVIMTTGDGRTTRLSTDGKTVKDDSTKIERKTKWDGGKLVSEISHLGPSKITKPTRPIQNITNCTSPST